MEKLHKVPTKALLEDALRIIKEKDVLIGQLNSYIMELEDKIDKMMKLTSEERFLLKRENRVQSLQAQIKNLERKSREDKKMINQLLVKNMEYEKRICGTDNAQ